MSIFTGHKVTRRSMLLSSRPPQEGHLCLDDSARTPQLLGTGSQAKTINCVPGFRALGAVRATLHLQRHNLRSHAHL